MGWGGNITDAYKDFTIDIIKGVKMNDEVTTERTLDAMDYNIRCKQKFIDSLLREIVDLQEENKRLREENVFLEHLRATSI